MADNVIKISDFRGGLATSEPTIIDDNQLAVAQNMYYDDQQNLTTRKGIKDFGANMADAAHIHSIYFTELSDGTRILLAGVSLTAGTTVVRRYNESTTVWDDIKTGMTVDLQLSIQTYKDVIYWTNGTDNFMSYDGTTVTEHAAVQKGKYLIIANDVAYLGHISNDKSVVFYTNTNPTDLTGAFPNFEPINEDDGQVITGVQNQGPLILVGKEESVYKLNIVASPVRIDQLDYSGGVSSHRSWVKMENDTVFLSSRGVYSLFQRQGTTGSLRALSITNDLQSIVDNVSNKSIAAGFYWEKTSNYYLAVDDGGGGKNKTLLVRNSIVGQQSRTAGWTEYLGINAFDFTEYEDSSGDKHLLVANAFGGQCIEMEAGFSDNGVTITHTTKTKTFDFDSPETLKTFPHVDVIGLVSSQANVKVVIDIDGTETTKTLDGGDYIPGGAGSASGLGYVSLDTEPLAGGAIGAEMPANDFVFRIPLYQTGRLISVKLTNNMLNGKWQQLKLDIPVIPHQIHVFPNNFIAT